MARTPDGGTAGRGDVVATKATPMNRQRVQDEITLREKSIVDATREFETGELPQADFEELLRREEEALHRARQQLAELDAVVADTAHGQAPRRRRKVYLAVALASFLVAVTVILLASFSTRQSGNSITGSISLSPSQRVTQLLAQAEADTANGNLVAALAAYNQVLNIAPSNATALTQVGWLDYSAGSSSRNTTLVNIGIQDLRRAIASAPTNPAPRLYYAIVAFNTPRDQTLARQQFTTFLALGPTKAQLALAAPYLAKLSLVPQG